ncbi:uncharacterized protein LOC6571723 [Drosophila grimshawi]|uniref:GH23430 n=1 Tax=Drosophila grimshawi TaxID=7222 RepID=B4K3P6_DROGR|nr:uncharacterized protein LOC6571723 [Drosophila grimshawi]EDW04333.1 GH23430 [Drosophila grimshawi]
MQLRSETFDQLKEMLCDAGLYEDGMNVGEMRQLAQAMELSNESVDGRECFDIQRALRESEIEFQRMVNSTMIGHQPTTPTRATATATTSNWPSNLEQDNESPPTNPIRMIVQAEVHHELNWSAEGEQRSLRKREAIGVDTDCEILAKRALQEQPNRDNNRPPSPSPSQLLMSSDSGLNCEEEEEDYSSLSSLSGLSSNNSMPSIGEMPSRLLISTSSAVVSDLSDQDQSGLPDDNDVDEEQP